MTTTPTTVTFVGAKGGVGTSTVAAMHALQLAHSGQPVHLSATSGAGVEDLAAILGMPDPAPGHIIDVAPGLTLGEELATGAANVVDGGTDRFSDHHGAVYVVLRNDYLSLRNVTSALPQSTFGLILVTEAGRALSRRDVEEVVRPVVAEIAVDPVIARAIDAGLLSAGRIPRTARCLGTALASPTIATA